VLGDYIFLFGNYTSNTCDVVIVTPAGTNAVIRGIPLPTNTTNLLAPIPLAPSRKDLDPEQSQHVRDLLKLGSTLVSIAGCAVSATSTLAGGGITLPVTLWACGSALVSVTSYFLEDNQALSGTSTALDTIGCLELEFGSLFDCPAMIADYADLFLGMSEAAQAAKADQIIAARNALRSSPITQGLIAYYPLNGDANDASGNGLHGTPDALSSFAPGVVGQAVYLHESGVLLPVIDFTAMSAFTISLWARISPESGPECLICYSDDGGGGVFIYNEATTPPKYQFHPGLGSGVLAQPSSYSPEDWHLYTLVYTAGSVLAYIDGQLMGTATGTVWQRQHRAALGVHWWSGGFNSSSLLTGAIDEVRIYNRALAPSEILQLHDYP